MSYLSQFGGGGGIPLGGQQYIDRAYGVGLIALADGKEFLRSGAAVAYASKYATASAAAPWLRLHGTPSTPSRSNLINFVENDSGTILGVGPSHNNVATSTDWSTFTERTPTLAGAGWRWCAWNSGSFVIVNDAGATKYLETSSNGTTWASQFNASFSGNSVGVAYASTLNLWVAMLKTDPGGISGEVYTRAAADPAGTWTARTPSAITCSGTAYGLVASPNIVLAWSTTGGVFSSTDGITWTSRSFGGCASVVWTGTKFLAFISGSGSSDVYESTNGTSWSMTTPLPYVISTASVIGAAANGSGVVIVNNSAGQSWYSTDSGTTWVPMQWVYSDTLYRPVWTRQRFILAPSGSFQIVRATAADLAAGPTYIGSKSTATDSMNQVAYHRIT